MKLIKLSLLQEHGLLVVVVVVVVVAAVVVVTPEITEFIQSMY